MWTSTLELDPKRILLTQLLGRFWPGAYFSFSAPLRVQNVPREALAASHWVRVRNRLAGICGSDLHLVYTKGDMRVAPAALSGRQPMYLGHEVVGEVIEIGDEVQHLRIGDRVVLQYHPNCLSSRALPLCHFCASGNYNLCERGELPGPSPLGGGWSEEMLLPEQQLFRVPATLNDEQAVMLEPAAVALHAVLRRLPQAGEHVLVIGAGTIGLLMVALVRALSPQARVSVLARYPFQIEQATRLGAEHIIYSQDSYQGVQQATQAEAYRGWFGNQMLLGGFDVIFDTIGSQSTLHHALRWARAGSALVLVGIDLHLMQIDMTPLWYQEISLLGSLGHGIENWPPATTTRHSTFDIAAELITQHRLAPEQLITHRFALTDYQHALTTAAGKSQNRAIKILFDYALLPASVVPNVRASARPRRSASSEQRPTSDNTEVPDEIEPSESELAEMSLQIRQEKDLADKMGEDTDEVPAIKKVREISPEDVLAMSHQETMPAYSTRLEPLLADELPLAIPTTQMAPADEIKIVANQGASEMLPEEVHEESSWVTRASEAVSGNNYQESSWAARASEAISGDSYQGFSLPEREHKELALRQEKHATSAYAYAPENEMPVTDAQYLVEAVEVEAAKQVGPIPEEDEQNKPEGPFVDASEWREEAPVPEEWELEAPIAENNEQNELDTIGEAMSKASESPAESLYSVVTESVSIVSATDESFVSASLQDELKTQESELDQQDEPEQQIDNEASQPVITDEQTSNNFNKQPSMALSAEKIQRGTRKKRATKEGSDTLQQVDATHDERKRSRPRARKKS